MIIGHGMLAKRFVKYGDDAEVLIIASGVSNSLEIDQKAFDRELNLVKNAIMQHPNKIFVYFSTSSMYDPASLGSKYTQHKLNVENYIRHQAKSYYIFRVSQIIGNANNSTLINFLVNSIKNQVRFDVWEHSTRNLIALDDVFLIVDYILSNRILMNDTINIANPNNILVSEVVRIVEDILQQKALFNLIDCGTAFGLINVEKISPILQDLNIEFERCYYKFAIKRMLECE